MPNFFLDVDFIVFLAFFKPPHPLTRALLFSEHLADSDLHCNCCAPRPMGTLPKLQEEDKKIGTRRLSPRGRVLSFFLHP